MVWPSFGWQIFISPYHAVTPGMPTAPRYADKGTCVVSTLRSEPGTLASAIEYSCQPPKVTTLSPGR
jgi:hypothetical protein